MRNINYCAVAVLGWILLNCLAVGSYRIYQEYKIWTFDAQKFVQSLDQDQLNDLAGALFAHKEVYDEPKGKK